jgi:hypothetical protein
MTPLQLLHSRLSEWTTVADDPGCAIVARGRWEVELDLYLDGQYVAQVIQFETAERWGGMVTGRSESYDPRTAIDDAIADAHKYWTEVAEGAPWEPTP